MSDLKNDVTEIHLVKDIIDPAVNKVYQRFRVALPGTIREFARTTSRAGVDLMVKLLGLDRVARDEPQVVDSPTILPRGGGYCVSFDPRAGDPCIQLCCDGPVRQFYEDGVAVTPKIPNGHQFGVSVTIPGGRVSSSVAGQETPPPNDEGTCWIGAEDGSSTIKFSGAQLPNPGELGSMVLAVAGPSASLKAGSDQSAEPVACATNVQANLDLLVDLITAWVPLAPPAIDNGASLKAVFNAWKLAQLPIADLKVVVDGPVPLPP